MDSVYFPTWENVNVPNRLLDNIRRRPSCPVLDTLVYLKVYHKRYKLQYTYHCYSCGKRYCATRVFDEYNRCKFCDSPLLKSTQNFNFEKRICPYSSSEAYTQGILHKMVDNYAQYFEWDDVMSSDIINIKWIVGGFCAQFIGGESVRCEIFSLALAKAAILCPFLWDDLYDWKHKIRRDKGREFPIVPLLIQWTRNG